VRLHCGYSPWSAGTMQFCCCYLHISSVVLAWLDVCLRYVLLYEGSSSSADDDPQTRNVAALLGHAVSL
jgi:hypothetical protein